MEPTSVFLFIGLYLVCVLAARASVRPFYKRIWSVAAFILGTCICIAVAIYLVGYVAVVFAL